MSKRSREIDWSKINGASPKPKRLHLEEDEEDCLFHCPVPGCDHDAFTTQRGCRKHVKKKHRWFYFFDEEPDPSHITSSNSGDEEASSTQEIPAAKRFMPCFDITCTLGREFEKWLIGSGGGCKTPKQARQIVRKSFKYLKFCCEDDDDDDNELSWDIVDFCLSSPSFIFKFVDAMQTDWRLGHAGRLGYLDAISDLLDFRKIHGTTSGAVLRNLTCAEIYLKRARKTVSKMMRLQWTNDLDIETLEAKGHWATLDELLQVIMFHLPRYECVINVCRETPDKVTPSDLSFATKFVAVYLFIKVKGSRPMTYQYLTVDMVESAKTNGGFIDQKKFKTTAKYGFDSLYLTDTSMQVLDGYIHVVRPLLKPNCEYVLVTRNGSQHSKIGQLMSKLVFDATGKYIHPTRYRQIVETTSRQHLDSHEQGTISEDQKHSSVVARVHYQKRRSREIATKAHECLEKLRGDRGTELTNDVRTRLAQVPLNSSDVEHLSEKSLALPDATAEPKEKSPKPNDPKPNTEVKSKRRKLVLFTEEEDQFLKAGIEKYGFGQWTAILKDPNFKFPKDRTTNSLLNRAMRKMKS